MSFGIRAEDTENLAEPKLSPLAVGPSDRQQTSQIRQLQTGVTKCQSPPVLVVTGSYTWRMMTGSFNRSFSILVVTMSCLLSCDIS